MKTINVSLASLVLISVASSATGARAADCNRLVSSFDYSYRRMSNSCHAEDWQSKKSTCIPLFRSVVSAASSLLNSRCQYDRTRVMSSYTQLKMHIESSRPDRVQSGRTGGGVRSGACYGPNGPGFWTAGGCVSGGRLGPGY